MRKIEGLQANTEALREIIAGHMLSSLGNWHCTCGRQDYGPRTRGMTTQRTYVEGLHAVHVAEVLSSEGAVLSTPDPREKFLRRAHQNNPG